MALQITWFVLIAVLLAGYAVLDGFDLGIGVLYPFLARDEAERGVLRGIIGPVWDGNEVWLITGAGALFAAFPPVYAMAFSGFYLAIMLVLFGLIMRAVSLEFHHRDEKRARLWDTLFFVGSLLPALLFGVAVGNVVRGVPLDAAGDYTGTFWQLLNPFSLLIGVTGLSMLVSHGAAWAAAKTQGALRARARQTQARSHLLFIVLLVGSTIYVAIDLSERLENVLSNPLGWLLIAMLLASLAFARLALRRARDLPAFICSALSIVSLIGIVAVGNYPAIVPARGSAPQTALTIEGTASSDLTLTAMLIVTCVGMPLVLAYTIFVYRTFRGRVQTGSIDY